MPDVLAALGFVYLFFLPGHLAILVATRRRLKGGRIPFIASVFTAVMFSLVLTSGLAHGLGAAGVYSTLNLLLLVGLFCLPLAAAIVRHRIPLFPWSLAPGVGFSLGMVALLLFLAFIYLPPAEYLFSDADEGIYINAGVRLAEHGGLWFQDDLLASLSPEHRVLHWGSYLPGFYFEDAANRNPVTSHGFHLLPSLIASLYSIGGMALALAAPCILMLLSVAALGLMTATVAGPRVGWAVAFLLGINPISVWFSRITFAEVLSETLLLGAFAFLAMGMSGERPSPTPRPLRAFWLLLGGVTLGFVHLAKIDFVAVSGVVLLAAVILWIRGRLDRRTALFVVGYGLILVLAAYHAVSTHRVYFGAHARAAGAFGMTNSVLLCAFFIALGLGAGLAFVFRRQIRRLARHSASRQLFIAVGVLCVLGALYLYFVLPARVDWYHMPLSEANWLQRALAKAPEFNEHFQQPSWREYTFKAIGLYVTAPCVLLGVAFTFVLLRRKDSVPLTPFLLCGMAMTAFFVAISGRLDPLTANFHAPGRRFLNITVPYLLVAAVIPWFLFGGTKRRIRLTRGIGALFLVYLSVTFLWASWPHIRFHSWTRTRDLVRQMAAAAPANAVWIAFRSDRLATRYAGPLRCLENRQTFILESPTGRAEPVVSLLLTFVKRGFAPVLLVGNLPSGGRATLCRSLLQLKGVRVFDVEEPTIMQQRHRLPDARDTFIWKHRLTVYGVQG